MAEADTTSASEPHSAPSRNIAEVMMDSAMDAFGSAIVLWLLGGIAISIAGSFAGEMIPSPPPGFPRQQPLESHASGNSTALGDAAGWTAFGLIFVIFFAHSLWAALHAGVTGGGRRIRRILSNLRENWFELTVGNAISAWVAILILGSVPNFSLWQMLSHAVLGGVLPGVVALERVLFGASASASVNAWFFWYDANHMKLTFWVIYLGGAFDDLGVPNFKTLARWTWRRLHKRKRTALPATAGPD